MTAQFTGVHLRELKITHSNIITENVTHVDRKFLAMKT